VNFDTSPKVAHILGVFQEMGSFNLDIVKENMFRYKDHP
jgi:hypothetical protein